MGNAGVFLKGKRITSANDCSPSSRIGSYFKDLVHHLPYKLSVHLRCSTSEDDGFLQVSLMEKASITACSQLRMLPASTAQFQKGDFLLPSLFNADLCNALGSSAFHIRLKGTNACVWSQGGDVTFALSRIEPFPSTEILAPVSS